MCRQGQRPLRRSRGVRLGRRGKPVSGSDRLAGVASRPVSMRIGVHVRSRRAAHPGARCGRSAGPLGVSGVAPAGGPLKRLVPDMAEGREPTGRVAIDAGVVRRLVAEQFPQWARLPVWSVEADGIDNRTFHLGASMSVRLPSRVESAEQVPKEQAWLPRLGPQLPLTVPVPLAMGTPGGGYPWSWSVYRWLDGENATLDRVADPWRLARTLAAFLVALQAIDATGGPVPGRHNFFRGGPLTVHDDEMREAIGALGDRVDAAAAARVWRSALGATWGNPPVWVHGDFTPDNLLVKDGRLSAVIDFGCCAVGDPACDLTIAWTLLSGSSRTAFRAAVPADDAMWARARGWALWKALISLTRFETLDTVGAAGWRRLLEEVLEDHRHATRQSGR